MVSNPKKPETALEATAVLAAKGRSFYWASHVLGKLHAQRATRLYRLCRHIDDIADECDSKSDASAELDRIVQTIRAGRSDDIIIEDGIQLFKECDIDCEIFIELIAGVQSDLHTVNIPDVDALLHYCFQVAGTVGLMMCKVLDTHDKKAFAHAVDLGIAMQLTNICRDVTADAEMGRRYLPASLVGELTPHDLLGTSEAVRKTVQSGISSLLETADTYYLSGEQGLNHLPQGARAGILLCARIYREIGEELQRRKLCFWGERAVVSSARKFIISFKSVGTLVFRHVLWVRPLPHDAQLHLPLIRTLPASAAIFLDHAR